MECSIEGCSRKRKYVKTGWCQTHYHRWWRHGDPMHVVDPEHTPVWKGERASYRAVHSRIQTRRGKASEHQCVCGKRADHWSYRGGEPNEQVARFDNRVIPFSTNTNAYDALCRGCHVKRDRYGSL